MRAYVYKIGSRFYISKDEPVQTVNVPVNLAPGEYVRINSHWDPDWKQSRLRKLWEDS